MLKGLTSPAKLLIRFASLNSILKLIALLCLLSVSFELNAQETHLFVKQKNETLTSYELPNIAKLTFSNGNMIVERKDGNSSSYSLANIRNLLFDIPNSIVNVRNNNDLSIYPNPANDYIIIDQSLNSGIISKVEILDIEGKVVLSKQILTGSANDMSRLDISTLKSGVYVCRVIVNEAVISKKFVKI
jgi:hypothetical protein